MDKNRNFRRYTQYIAYVFALLVVGWGFTPYQSIFLGLMLGIAVSAFNVWFTYRKVKKLGDAAVNGQKAYSLGMLTRFALAALAVLITLRYPETFHLLSVVIGLMIAYIIIFIDLFIHTIRTQ